MAAGVNGGLVKRTDLLPAQRVNDVNRLDRIAEELHAQRLLIFIGRKDLHDIAPDAEGAAVKIDVVALILNFHQTLQNILPGNFPAHFELNDHPQIGLRRTQTVNARNARHDDDISPRQKRVSGRVAKFVDFLVDGGILFDIGVRRRQVGFRLIVIVIADKIFDGIVGEKALEFLVQLRGQGFVVCNDERRTARARNHVGNGKGFAGAGHPEQHLMLFPASQPFGQSVDRLRLIAGGNKIRD
ncbi:MAG: hypothetical protein BWX45_01239 [Deltaproteobacteria bacterium ADurb.Bin002]|nr:MAG: hypothetical protein BWX45_01239 [Deltaproteobacteria bacterium ADurb.Bin002]